MLRDKLLARLAEMGAAPDHQRLAAEVLGIRGAPPALAKRLVAQALVLEDRRDVWRAAGERICRHAPAAPGVYELKDADGRPPYARKPVHLRARRRAPFAVHSNRLWRFFNSALRRARTSGPPLAPLVYSWLAGRGESATRVDPHAAHSVQQLRARLAALLRDDRLFHERLEQC